MAERLEIDALRAIVAIASYGGVTRASEHLALSQSAVSHKVKRLEHTLGCTLLARRAGGPLFTDAGERLLAYARRMIDLQDEALASMRQMKLTGSIQVGMTEDITSSGIAKILGRFSRLYPDVSVKTRIAQSLTLEEQLKSNTIDVAVMQIFRNKVREDDLILYDDSLHWVKSPELHLQSNKPIPFLAFDECCFYKHWAENEGQSSGHTFETVFECPSAAGILAGVRSGMGVALLNQLHITQELDVVSGVFPTPPDIAYIVRTNPNRQTKAVNSLVKEISREIKSNITLRVA